MIRVNLLATAAAAKPAGKAFLPPEQRTAAIGLAMLLATAAGVGGTYWFFGYVKNGVHQEMAAAEIELSQFRQAAALVSQMAERKTELTERLTLIERLRAAKRGPVQLLQTVSRSVPEGLWLIEMRQQGTSLQVDGRAMTLTAVSDFAERLQSAGYFQRPVEIVTTASEIFEETPVIRFTLRAEVVTPEPPAGTPAATPAAPASRSGAPSPVPGV